MKRVAIFVFALLLSGFGFGQQYRYVNPVFEQDTIHPNIVFGVAPAVNSPYNDETNTSDQQLLMDIYEPYGDTSSLRPAIVFIHGGGFIEGNRHHDDMVAFCDTFANMGYVTATIEYRQGMYVASSTFTPISSTRAVYRGVQDGRRAIRYLRAHAQEYRIDTNRIYVVGSSAGAFIGLHSIYMTKPSEKPAYAGEVTYQNPLYPYNNITAPDLGGYDVGENLAHSGTPNIVVDLWGAVGDTVYIENDELKPVLLIHGTDDDIVPFLYGHPFGVDYIPSTYGSGLINQRLDNMGFTDKETYFVPGEGHEFYGVTNGDWDSDTGGNAYWDTVVFKIKMFLYEHHKPQAGFTYTVENGTGNVNFQFTGSADAKYFRWDFAGLGNSSEKNPSFSFPAGGLYDITLYVENEIHSWDTITQTIYVPTFPLNGVYYIGDKTQGDNFNTLSEAVDTLNNAGISGDVTFILSQNYNAQNETFPIKIQNYSKSAPDLKLTITTSIPVEYQADTVLIDMAIGCSNIVFDGGAGKLWTMKNSPIFIRGSDVTNIIVRNFNFEQNSAEYGLLLIGNGKFELDNNYFRNATCLSGTDTTYFHHNIGYGFTTSFAWRLGARDYLVIDHNQLRNIHPDKSTHGNAIGIEAPNFVFSNNLIDSITIDSIGAIIVDIDNFDVQNAKIYNNAITNVKGFLDDYGLYTFWFRDITLYNLDFYYNTITFDTLWCRDNGNNLISAIFASPDNSSVFKVKDNIFYFGKTYGEAPQNNYVAQIMLNSFIDSIYSDYNLFYTETSDIIDLSGVYAFYDQGFKDFDTWQSDYNQDLHSLNTEPLFEGNGSFRLLKCSPAINAGTPISYITTDLEDYPRDETPNMGAYEMYYDFYAEAGEDITGCETSYTISANDPSPFSGYWSVVQGSATVENPNSYTTNVSLPDQDETVKLVWTVGTEICFETDTLTIYHYRKPYATLEFTDTTVFVDSSLQITVNSNVSSYQWYKDGQALSDDGHYQGTNTNKLIINNIQSSDEGLYYCEVNNDSVCFAMSDTLNLTVTEGPSQVFAGQSAVYPNPTNGKIFIQHSEVPAEITLFNNSGQVLIREKSCEKSPVIDLSGFPAGIYILKIKSATQTDIYKVIKR